MTMAGSGYACALLLALVFAAAALAKLRDLAGTAASFATLGLPASVTLARAVPASEAVIAVLLVVWPPAGAALALASMVFFTTFLVTRLRAGVRAPCSCFGSSQRAPISAANLVGNGFLVVLALVALASPGPVRPTVVDVAVVAAVVVIEIAVYALVRRRVAPMAPTLA